MIKSIALTITPKLNEQLDYFFITGDVYDRLITDCDSAESKAINGFITWVVSRCAKFNIKLRVLKGTSNHDARQCENFVSINDGMVNPCDLKYFDKVGVHFEDGFSMLVVPDNAATTHAGVRAKVEEALKTAGVTQVDMALTHGMYDNHLLAKFTDEMHDSAFYMSIVRTLILNGHIHTSTLYGHLLTIGSFDRTAQGEEESKGGHYGTIDIANKTFTAKFLENTYATIFRTLTIPPNIDDVAKAYTFIIESLGDLAAKGGWLALAHNPLMDIKELLSRLNDTYANFIVFSSKKVKDKTKDDVAVEFKRLESKPINRNTIMEMLDDKFTRLDIPFTDLHREIIAELM
jgi:hypothetical protein